LQKRELTKKKKECVLGRQKKKNKKKKKNKTGDLSESIKLLGRDLGRETENNIQSLDHKKSLQKGRRKRQPCRGTTETEGPQLLKGCKRKAKKGMKGNWKRKVANGGGEKREVEGWREDGRGRVI